MNTERRAKANGIIQSNTYCTIATSTIDGKPWISPMYFQVDINNNIYWLSAKNCKHSKLIESNPHVAITVFDSHAKEGTASAVYITGRAIEVSGKELEHATRVMYQQKSHQRNPSDFSKPSPRRLYKATIDKMWILEKMKKVDGHLLDARHEVHL